MDRQLFIIALTGSLVEESSLALIQQSGHIVEQHRNIYVKVMCNMLMSYEHLVLNIFINKFIRGDLLWNGNQISYYI